MVHVLVLTALGVAPVDLARLQTNLAAWEEPPPVCCHAQTVAMQDRDQESRKTELLIKEDLHRSGPFGLRVRSQHVKRVQRKQSDVRGEVQAEELRGVCAPHQRDLLPHREMW